MFHISEIQPSIYSDLPQTTRDLLAGLEELEGLGVDIQNENGSEIQPFKWNIQVKRVNSYNNTPGCTYINIHGLLPTHVLDEIIRFSPPFSEKRIAESHNKIMKMETDHKVMEEGHTLSIYCGLKVNDETPYIACVSQYATRAEISGIGLTQRLYLDFLEPILKGAGFKYYYGETSIGNINYYLGKLGRVLLANAPTEIQAQIRQKLLYLEDTCTVKQL